MKLLSIIVTTLNAAKSLPLFLESIKNQNNQDFDLIIVDGGSTDETISLINNSGINLRFFFCPGLSIYQGLNEGIKRCESDYYIIIGGDDELEANAVTIILQDLKKKSEVDLFLYSIKRGDKIVNSNYPNKLRKILGWQSIVSSHSVGCVINKKLHEKFGYYSMKYKVLADGYFLTKILNSGTNTFVSKSILGTFSITGTSNKSYYENIFGTFLIQIKFKAFFPQLILLIARLIKYRNLADL